MMMSDNPVMSSLHDLDCSDGIDVISNHLDISRLTMMKKLLKKMNKVKTTLIRMKKILVSNDVTQQLDLRFQNC